MCELHAEVSEPEMVLSEETVAAINDLLFPPIRSHSRLPGRKRRILRKPVENPDNQPKPDFRLDILGIHR